MIEENHEKTPVRLVATGIWTRDLPNASLVRYHGAISLGSTILFSISIEEGKQKNKKYSKYIQKSAKINCIPTQWHTCCMYVYLRF